MEIQQAPRNLSDGRLAQVVGALRRWLEFAAEEGTSGIYAKPGPLARFLRSVSQSGPTAASGVWKALQFWVDNCAFTLPLDHHLCLKFRLRDINHQTVQAQEMLPWEFFNMVVVAQRSTGSIQTIYNDTIFITLGCVRWEHVQRSSVVSGGDSPVLHCSKGKARSQGARPGFDWSVHQLPGKGKELNDAVTSFWQENLQGISNDSFLVPAVQLDSMELFTFTSDSGILCGKKMSRRQYMEIVRGHLVAAGVDPAEAAAAKYNRLRRFLPTAANVFMVSDADAQAVGNWTDVPQGKMSERASRGSARRLMSFRYAGDKCARSGRVKQHLVDTLFSVFKEIWRRSRDAQPDVLTGILQAGSISWELVAATFDSVKMQTLDPPPEKLLLSPDHLPADELMKICDEEKDDSEGKPSAASGSDESPSASDDECDDLPPIDDPVALAEVEWFIQGKRWHLVSEVSQDDFRVTPWCRDKPYDQDPRERGFGIEALEYDNLCHRCLARAPLPLSPVLTDHFGVMS